VTAEERLGEGIRALFDGIQEQLERAGISIEFPDMHGEGQRRMKVVVVAPDLKDSVDELSQQTRDQVVMVRVDQDTLRTLDAWVATGAVRSRSEAAALFICEGLKVREAELSRLESALAEVDAAKERLRQQAREVFGGKD
jgi:hypothetical protein